MSSPTKIPYEFREPVTPYVCSTPGDFLPEREFIRSQVFPQLDEMCRLRGSYFSPVDFTWGDKDSKMESGILLKTQLDAVKQCSPFFIGILGETYGPHRAPEAPRVINRTNSRFGRGSSEGNNVNSLDKNFLVASHAGHSWVLEDAHQSSSITELEVTQANFLCDNQHSTLYYRQLEHLEDKLELLKKRQQLNDIPTTGVTVIVNQDCDNDTNTDNDMEINENNDVHEALRQALVDRYASESEYAKTKVRDLKQRLVNRGIPVKYFRTLEELGQHVLQDWTEIIDMVLPPLLHNAASLTTIHYNEWTARQSFTKSRTRVFVTTDEVEELLQELSDFALTCTKADAIHSSEQSVFPLANPQRDAYSASMTSFLQSRSPLQPSHPSPSILMLGGDRGVGKSSIVSRWIQDFQSEYPHIFVKANFVSASSCSSNLCDFMRGCINDLRKKFILSDDYQTNKLCVEMERDAMSNFSSFSALCQAFVAALSLGPCVIVFDGLNELTSCLGLTVQEVKEFAWLPDEIPACCKLIVTTTKSDISHRSLSERSDVVIASCPSSLTESIPNVALVREYAPNADQLLGGDQKVRHLGSLRVMQSALGSRVISNEILRPPVYQNLSSFMDQWADIWSLRNFWIQSVQSWVQSHSWLSDSATSEIQFIDNGFDYSGWVADSLCLIALSRNGLTQHQILSILKTIGYEGDLQVKDYEWHQFMLSAAATLHTNSDGRIIFSHSYLHEVAEYLFFKSMSSVTHDPVAIQKSCKEGLRQAYHTHLSRFFSQEALSVQTMEELPWHLMLCGDMLGLMDFLTDSGVILKTLDSAESEMWLGDMKLYWSVCSLNGYRADHSYLSMMYSMGVVDTHNMQIFEAENEGEMSWSPSPRIVISTPQPMTNVWGETGVDMSDGPGHKVDRNEQGEQNMSLASSKGFDVEDIESQEKHSQHEEDDNLDESFGDGIFVTQNGQTHSASMSRKTSSKLGGAGRDHFPTMTILGWRIAQLLSTLGYAKANRCLLTCLVKYMQQNYPLSLSQHLLMSQCHFKLGEIHEASGHVPTAEMEYRLAVQSVMTADDMDDEMENQPGILYLKSSLLCSYGKIVLSKGDLLEAEELLKESLECIEDNNDCYILRSNIHQHLGQLRALQNDFTRAEACLRQSAQLRSQWVGSSHPLVADVFVELARILTSDINNKSFDAGQAESLFREALRIREVTVGPTDISVASVLFELGTLLAAEQSQLVKMEAQKLLRRSLDIRTTELGINHPQTAAVQQSLTHLDVALKLGHYEFGPAKPKEGRSRKVPFSAMTFRDSDISRLKNRYQSSVTPLNCQDPMNVRSVSREEVMRHNRPDSIGSMASERLVVGPVGDGLSRHRLLSRDRNRHGFDSGRSSYNGNKENTNLNNNGSAQDLVVLDSLDSKGRRLTIEENNKKNNVDGELNLDINDLDDRFVDGCEKDSNDNDNNNENNVDDVVDDVYIDSYASYTNLPPRNKDKKKRAQVRPSSAPRKMFQRFQNMEIKVPPGPTKPPQTPPQALGNTTATSTIGVATPTSAGRKSVGSVQRSRRNLWSGRSNASSVATTSGHFSRCSIPDRYDISHSTARTISGPHSSLQALLGDSPCPRPPSNNVHHRSAWYHVPGRYSTPDDRYPRKRNQKTENAKDIDAFLALKSHWEKKKTMQKQLDAQREYYKNMEEEISKKKSEQELNDDDLTYQQFYVDKVSGSDLERRGMSSSGSKRSNFHQKARNQNNAMYKKSGGPMQKSGKWYVNNRDSTPRLMISGLDKVPEPRYNFEQVTRPSQGHGVKFKEPIVVG